VKLRTTILLWVLLLVVALLGATIGVIYVVFDKSTRERVSAELVRSRDGSRASYAGIVICRQRPSTAKGVVFMTLEDETDIANIIIWPKVFAKNRPTVMTTRFVAVRGFLQRAGLVVHVLADSFIDLSGEMRQLYEGDFSEPGLPASATTAPDIALLKSRDFH
jgi:error-prone DNA polymerase